MMMMALRWLFGELRYVLKHFGWTILRDAVLIAIGILLYELYQHVSTVGWSGWVTELSQGWMLVKQYFLHWLE